MKVLYKIKANNKHIRADHIRKVHEKRWSFDMCKANTLKEVTVGFKFKVLKMVNIMIVTLQYAAQYSLPHKNRSLARTCCLYRQEISL
jgi:hypothetical protein